MAKHGSMEVRFYQTNMLYREKCTLAWLLLYINALQSCRTARNRDCQYKLTDLEQPQNIKACFNVSELDLDRKFLGRDICAPVLGRSRVESPGLANPSLGHQAKK